MDADPLRWSFETGAPICCGVTVAAGLVVTASEDGCAYGVDAADGTLRWRVTGARCLARTCPAIVGGRVFLYTRDRDLLALDATDGSALWRRQGLGGEPGSSPRGSRTCVQRVPALLATARKSCVRTREHGSGPVMVAPAFAGGMLYVASPGRHLYAFEIA